MEDGAQLCFPLLVNTSCRRPVSSGPEAALLHVVLYSVSVLTVALNLLVIISISHFRQLHTPTNILLLSLAVSDLLVGLLLIPGEVLRRSSCWFLGDVLCSLYNYVSLIVTSASVGDMVLISVDRYVAVCDPLRYGSRVTGGRVRVCVCVCWLCSVLYGSVLVKDDLTRPGRFPSCRGACLIVIDPAAGAVDLVLTFLVPIAVILVLYARVFVAAATQARAMRRRVTLQLSVTVSGGRAELKAARTLGVLVLVFLLSFCPYYAVSLAGEHLLNSSSGSSAIFVFYLNSCLNPLIYALFYPWFRTAGTLIVSLQVLQVRPASSRGNVRPPSVAERTCPWCLMSYL